MKKTHRNRRSIRLKGYDYSQVGLYFVTICVKNRLHLFGDVCDGEMVLNEYGKIANDEWQKIPKRYPNVSLGVFQIMPNHIHGIIALNDNSKNHVGATLAVARAGGCDKRHQRADGNDNQRAGVTIDARAGASPAPTTVGQIIGAYKSLVTIRCLEIFKSKNKYMGKLWQRNYHEHIIRNNHSHKFITNYIINNPKTWEKDRFYL